MCRNRKVVVRGEYGYMLDCRIYETGQMMTVSDSQRVDCGAFLRQLKLQMLRKGSVSLGTVVL